MAFPLWFGGGSKGSDEQGALPGTRLRLVSSDTEPATPVYDATLVARLRAGDQNALRDIMTMHGPPLLALASAVAGSAELGDDVVQQVFIRLWDRRESLVVHGSLRQYLWRAARNQAISVRRHERFQRRLGDDPALVAYVARVSRNSGEEALDTAAFVTQVTVVLQALPARCREIFLLNWRDALTPAEIADALGVGVATVRNQILRAVKHLGAHFGR